MNVANWLTVIGLVSGAIGAILLGQHRLITKMVSEKLDQIIKTLGDHEDRLSRHEIEFAGLKGQLKGKGCLSAEIGPHQCIDRRQS